jgi:hypothetical protein
MSKDKTPGTPAVHQLRAAKIQFTDHPYEYEDKGGTAVSARELGVSEHAVVKTLVMEDESRTPLVVLMHGDLKVSTKELARIVGVKSIALAIPRRRTDIPVTWSAAHRRSAHARKCRSTWNKQFCAYRKSTLTLAGAAISSGWPPRTWCGCFPQHWSMWQLKSCDAGQVTTDLP